MARGFEVGSDFIQGNMLELSEAPSAERNAPSTFGFSVGREVGDAIAFWALQKAGFWRIVRPFLIQHMAGDEIENIGCLLTPHQIRQRLCLLPSEDELYYKERILDEEQLMSAYRWDYLALRIQKSGDGFEAYPSLIDVTTQEPRGIVRIQHGLYRKKQEDIDRVKETGFRVFRLEIILGENWRFKANIEEI
jgi:hypothetical protein